MPHIWCLLLHQHILVWTQHITYRNQTCASWKKVPLLLLLILLLLLFIVIFIYYYCYDQFFHHLFTSCHSTINIPLCHHQYYHNKIPYLNTATEFERGASICMQLESRKLSWEALFERPRFFTRYKTYIQVEASAGTVEQLNKWYVRVSGTDRVRCISYDSGA